MPPTHTRPRIRRRITVAAAAALCAGMLAGCDAALAATGPQRPDAPTAAPAAPDTTGASGGPTGTGTAGDTMGATAADPVGNGGDQAARTGGGAVPTAATPTPAPGDRATRGNGQNDGPAPDQGRAGREKADRAKRDPKPPVDPNPNCTLILPPAPRTAAGLATPYRLTATNRGAGACHEANPDQSAFVEATILDPGTGKLSIYRPLVIDDGTAPAAPLTPPALPAGAVVGVWFGFQGDTLTLRAAAADGCVNGLPGSPFGQFAYCGAAEFFTAANAAITAGKLAVPALGTANDGMPCPSTRDFAVVDQDQSDNLTTSYLALPDGRTAQDTPANAGLTGAKRLTNASDNGLLVRGIDPALGCLPFTAPDLTTGAPATSLALNELQAAHQGAPVALIPPNDPMALVRGKPSTAKVNLYRTGAGQPALDPAKDTGKAYCEDLAAVAPKRLALDRGAFSAAPSPDPATAKNLFTFLTQRLTTSWEELGCQALTGKGAPKVR